MKKILYYLLILSVTITISCGGNKGNQTEDTLSVYQDTVDAKGNQRMQPSKAEQKITFNSKEYTSVISRVADESLPLVKYESSGKYVDNSISLHLTRGAEMVFSKTFTKNDFASVVGNDFLSKSILEGIVYNKTTPQGIQYAASVCYPQTDLFVLIAITITADGKMSMVKDEQMEESYTTEEGV